MLATTWIGVIAPSEPTVAAVGALITGTAVGLMVKATGKLPLPKLLVACNVALNMPLTVGVPLINPVLVFKFSPVGKLPAITL